MRLFIVRAYRLLAGYLPAALVLTALGGLAYLGQRYHWKLPHGEHDPPAAPGHRRAPAGSDDLAAVTRQAGYLDPAGGPPPLARLELAPEAARKAGIRLEPVRERPLDQFLAVNGVVDYDQTLVAELSSRAAGTVWSVEKRVGDVVRRGEVLALVEAADVGKAKADFQQYLVLADVKQRILDQMNRRADAHPPVRIQEAEAAVREARIRLFNAQQALVNLGLPVRKHDIAGLSEEELGQRLRFLGLPPEVVQSLDPETATANLLPLRAPFDGVVVGREVVVGETVRAAEPQFVLADVRRMWIVLDVRQEDADRVEVGQPFTFQPDGAAEPVRGTLDWISTEANPRTRTVQVRAGVANPTGRLRAHIFGTGRVRIRHAPRAVAVPSQAVQSVDGRPVVFVRGAGSAFLARAVELGIRGEEFTEIRTGLRPGEEVATIGSHLLKSEIIRRRQAEGADE